MSRKRLPRTDTPSLEALLYEAQKRGILPITSECTSHCVFCSNRFNPPSCEVLNIGRRSLDEVKESLPWLSPAPGPIVIGESVTRINEGEPLCHPDFAHIVRNVRRAYPDRVIKVTTNGMLLTPELVELMSEAQVKLTVSLNTVSKRREIMGDRDPQRTLAAISSLKGKVEFDGSIVALPFLTGYPDIRESVKFLKHSGATTVRLLLPGFSRRHPLYKMMPEGTWEELREMAVELSAREKIPVLADPPELSDLDARVEYVLPGSPAAKAGILPGDVVIKVAGRDVFSRRDAFQKAYEAENPVVTVLREGHIEYKLHKRKASPPGFIMYDDLDPREYFSWERASGILRGHDVLVLTSKPAKSLVEVALARRGLEARVVAVRSYFFGGNIQVAGLLTVRDFLAAYKRTVRHGKPHTVTLPARAFDAWGRDLEGVHYRVFTQETGVPVVLAG
ncbi:MAG TPA: DUF512 domain-containing protein [Firmicutes bacterium]|nr:DUF512 domain-containing protein [Candidatus Fermentithermobacillaceae bacterium]